MKRKLTTLLLVVGMTLGFASPAHAQSMSCGHFAQGIHEIAAPASWPGTRAAHTVANDQIGSVPIKRQVVYTKSGWWDPTWDFYYQNYWVC